MLSFCCFSCMFSDYGYEVFHIVQISALNIALIFYIKHLCPGLVIRGMWIFWESFWGVAEEGDKDCTSFIYWNNLRMNLLFLKSMILLLFRIISFQIDKLGYKEQEVSLLVKLGRLEEGEKLYQTLLSMNPDNYRWTFWLLFIGLHV